MDVLLFSFNAVAPMFIAIFLGALLARRGFAGEREIIFLNTLCFRYLLSTHVFNSVLSVNFYTEFNPRLAAMLGFRGPELGALAVVFAAPSAVGNLIMARHYGVAPRLVAQTVYLSTLLSLATIFCVISILRGAGLF